MNAMGERMVREKIHEGKKKSESWCKEEKNSEDNFLVDSGVYRLL